MYPIHVLQLSTRPKFHCFALRLAVFELQGIVRKVHINDPQMTLNITSSNVPICANSVPDSQMSLRFALRPAILEI